MKQPSGLTRPVLLALAGAAAIASAVYAMPGCTKPPVYKDSEGTRANEDPWPPVVAQLRKESDPATCRRVLGKLNTDLGQNPDAPQPAGMSDAEAKAARDLLGLSEDELKELRPPTYSPLDPNYLAECLYLRDAARSLDTAGLPPGRQAELAFAWVCRQVVLQPWTVPTQRGEQPMPPVSVTAVLRRGSGSGLERAYVLLALLQQLGLDGCLVGPPEAATRTWAFGASAGQLPKGPFWAVGVRAGSDVLLFDPWRGEPVPGPGGQGVGTLAQVKANPDQLKAWREDKGWKWGVPAEEVKASVPFLAVPLTAVAPRMRLLEQELRADLPVRLAVDPAAVREKFAAETRLPDLKFWNPQAELFSYTRVLGTFTPPEEGGRAPNDQLSLGYKASLLPRSLFTIPADLLPQDQGDVGVPEAKERIQIASLTHFGGTFMTPPTPREQVQRGQFYEAAPSLMAKRQAFLAAHDRIRHDHDRARDVRLWAEKARDVYTRLARAKDQERANPGAADEAQQAVAQFWAESARTFDALVDVAVADAGLAESTYLLAQCKHEQAEQLQARYERLAADPKQKAAAEKARDKAANAWREAKGWWEMYGQYADAQEKTFPGRAAHAKRLAERAARLAPPESG